jgi:hypothetical protein
MWRWRTPSRSDREECRRPGVRRQCGEQAVCFVGQERTRLSPCKGVRGMQGCIYIYLYDVSVRGIYLCAGCRDISIYIPAGYIA